MKNKALYIALCIFFGCLKLQAQEKDILPEDLRCETNITEPLNLRRGFIRTSLGFAFTPYDSYFSSGRGRSRIISSDGGLNISGNSSYTSHYRFNIGYGITNNLDVSLELPYYYGEDTQLLTIEYVPWNVVTSKKTLKYENGFGDLDLTFKYQFIHKDDLFSSVYVDFCFPSGSLKKDTLQDKNYTKIRQSVSNDRYEVGFGIHLKKVYYPFSLGIMPSFNYSFENAKWKASSSFAMHGSWGVLLNDWFSLNNSWSCTYVPKMVKKEIEFVNKNIYFLTTGVSINQQAKRFRFTENLFFPIAGSNNFPSNMNLLFAIYYTM